MARTEARDRRPSEGTKAAREALRKSVGNGKGSAIPARPRAIVEPDEQEEAAFASTSGRRTAVGRVSPDLLDRARRTIGHMDEPEPPAVRGYGESAEVVEETDEDLDAQDMDTKREAPQFRRPAQRTPTAVPLNKPRVSPFDVTEEDIARAKRDAGFSPFDKQDQSADVESPSHGKNVVRSALFPNLTARQFNVEDVDRLWDWIRADGPPHFLNRDFRSSLELHTFFNQMRGMELHGASAIRSLIWEQEHFGFLMLSPILSNDRTALCHVYVRSDARSSLSQMIGAFVAIAEQLAPKMHLAFYVEKDSDLQRIGSTLQKLGFGTHVMFIR